MNFGSAFLKLLNIDRNEKPLVLNLVLIQFFQGAGIAFFFTAAFAMFLERLSVNDFPWVFILAAIMLFITGFLYSWLEHRIRISSLGMFIGVSMVVSIVLFRILTQWTDASWFLMLMLSWFYVLYLLNNLSFWGFASVSFDIRQSKRLFGVISSGDIPAKFVGYSIASILVSYIGTVNLLLVGAAFISLSLPSLIKISLLKLNIQSHQKHSHQHEHKPVGLASLIKRFTVNKLIEKTAILAFIFSLCLILVNFIFYAEIKTAYSDNKELARFIASFLAGSRIVAMLLKLVFTSRLLSSLGPKKSLMITPLVLSSFVILILLGNQLGTSEKTVFYLFGMLAIAADILNSSLHLPGFLTLMQPLPLHERLKAHHIAKGVMDPFAYLTIGVLLLLVIRLHGHANIIVLTYALLAILIFWVIGILEVNREYLRTLIRSITTRTFNQGDISIADKESLALVATKLNEGTELEKMYLLRLLRSNPDIPNHLHLVEFALKEASTRVRLEALHALDHIDEPEVIHLLENQLISESDPTLKVKILHALDRISADKGFLTEYLGDSNPEVRAKAAALVLSFEAHPSFPVAEKLVKAWVHSLDPQERVLACSVIGELKSTEFYHHLGVLLNDKDHEVSAYAMLAAGKIANSNSLKFLLDQLTSREEVASDALMLAGEAALPFIHRKMSQANTTPEYRKAVFRLLGRMGGERGSDLLLAFSLKYPGDLYEITESLRRIRFRASTSQETIIENHIQHSIAASKKISVLLEKIEPLELSSDILRNALGIEMLRFRDMILDLIAFNSKGTNVEKIKRSLKSSQRNSKAIATELIEISLPVRYSHPFLSLFEGRDLNPVEGRVSSVLKTRYLKEIAFEILVEHVIAFDPWTKACCLFTIRQENARELFPLGQAYQNADSALLRETALQLNQ